MTRGAAVRLDAATLIDLADHATLHSVAQWSVAVLLAGFPGMTRDQALALPLGTRDRLVMQLRAARFGPRIDAQPVCADCGAPFELILRAEDIGLGRDAPEAAPDPRPVKVDGRQVTLRPVTLADLLAVETVADPARAASLLAARVGGPEAPDLPPQALDEALEALDPAADIWLASDCPECAAPQRIAFDPVHFMVREIGYLARQLMRDVADIARVFKWSERDILALPEMRREFYLHEALG